MGEFENLSTADLKRLVAGLSALAPALGDADRVDRIAVLESMRSAVAAAQAVVAAAFDASQRAAQAAQGVPVERQGRGVAQQVALARGVSPFQGQRWLSFAKIMTSELPCAFAELAAGRTSEWRVTVLARETATLTREHRALLDADLAPRLCGWGDRRVDIESRRAAYALDAEAVVRRARNAESQRRVGIRPAPDTMVWLSALLPVAQGVAACAALHNAANHCTAVGDPRSRGQVMADTLVERVTGQAKAEDVNVEIVLVINDDTLIPHPNHDHDHDRDGDRDADRDTDGDADADRDTDADADRDADRDADAHADGEGGGGGDDERAGAGSEKSGRRARRGDEPAWIDGYGPVPADWARELAYGRHHPDHREIATKGKRWIRRLYTHRGRPIELESTRRLFNDGQQRFLRLRDQTCRTPYCDAPIRHADHIKPHHHGGRTHTSNGQGLCEACNHAKQASGWTAVTQPDGTITTQTPTGHTYNSPPPDIVGTSRSADDEGPNAENPPGTLA